MAIEHFRRIPLLLLAATIAQAGDVGDKGRYHLFNPVPAAEMREFDTDRPDKTESPYTVDAGHFQFETDLLTYIHDREGGVLRRIATFNAINLKAGLSDRVDLQLILASYVKAIGSDAGGFGDTTVRLKINLVGNDEGEFALGVMPFAKLPTAADDLGNGALEAGVIVPAALALPAGFGLGGMLQLNRFRNDGPGYRTELVATLAVGRDLVGDLAGYVELFSQSALAPSSRAWVSTFDAGLTYALTPDTQLDLGINLGLTDAADDLNPFAGLSMRF